MRSLIIVLLILFNVFISCNKKEKLISEKIYVDEIGNKIELTKNPEKIISTAPNLTEIIFAIDAGNILVGRTRFCNYPNEVNKVQVIGDMLNLNFEKIVELKPDLIFMTVEGNTKELYDKLKGLGFQVYVTNPRNLNDIITAIKNLGIILNRERKADSLVSSIKDNLTKIASKNFQRQRAMFVVSISPLIIAGKNTFINEIMEKVNLENISPKNSISSYPMISREEVLIKNPDVIIIPSSKYKTKEILRIYPEWKNLSAVKNRKIMFVDPDLFLRPGPRFIDAIKFLGQELSK